MIVKQIIEGKKLTLIGPKTDLEGIFHGAFYYYLIAIPYFIGKGNPSIPAFLIAFINAVGTIFTFLIGKRLSPLSRTGAALIYAFSFQGIVFSRWLSNPSLVIPLSTILLLLITNKFTSTNFILSILIWGIIFHLEIASGVFLVPVLIFYLIVNIKKINLRLFLYSFVIFLLVFSPFIIFDLRHNHLLSKAIFTFFFNHPPSLSIFSLINILGIAKASLREFNLHFLPQYNHLSSFIFGISFLVLILKIKNTFNKIILLWLVSPFIFLFPLKSVSLSQTLVHLSPAFYILVGLLVDKFIKITRNQILIIEILVLFSILNFIYNIQRIPNNESFFFRSYQYTFLGDQKKTIDFIYKEAGEEKFSFDYYTFPYWLPQGWNYLFEYYGKKKYGYLPITGQRTKTFFCNHRT